VAKNASEASDASIHTHTESQDIKAMMSGCMQSITQLANEILQGANAVRVLEKDTDQIGTVLDVIRGIAEQTNLLALNAAIEAARAGDQGRGFAVVADEVRVLAQNSQQSTEEIQRMIKQLRVGTQSAVDAMEQSNATSQEGVSLVAEADSAMDSIASSSQTVCDLNAQIATAAQEQSLVAEEINRSMINISEVTEQISKRWYDRRAKRAAIQKAFDELVEQATRIRA
jgi:methyl-accepting chemotaxis protein